MGSVAIFMSRGTSLADWHRQGILERETAIYRAQAQEGGTDFYLFVPDTHIDKDVRETLRPIQVVGPGFTTRCRIMRKCVMVRGHNGRALIAPLVWSWLFRKALALRFGYIWSLDIVNQGRAGLKLWAVLFLEWLACRRAVRVLTATEAQARYLHDVHGIQ